MAYTMSVNKKYLLTTNYNTIIARRVKVLGVINYNECIKTSFDVFTMGNNEKFFVTEDVDNFDYESVMKSLEFYKCEDIDTGALIIVWSDIINPNKTSIIDEEYTMRLGVKLPVTNSNPTSIDNLMIAVKEFVASKYGATFDFTIIKSDDYTEEDRLRDQLSECKSIINSLSSFKTITPIIETMYNNNITKKLTDIDSSLGVLSDKVSLVAANL